MSIQKLLGSKFKQSQWELYPSPNKSVDNMRDKLKR